MSPAFMLSRIGIASSSHFVASSSVVIVCCHSLYSGQYLKNGLSDLIQIWHVDVAGPKGDLKLPIVRYLNSI